VANITSILISTYQLLFLHTSFKFHIFFKDFTTSAYSLSILITVLSCLIVARRWILFLLIFLRYV